MKHHEFANLFPLLDDVSALADDIAANGQREAITVFEGQILDGRNRFRACEQASVTPKTVAFKGSRDEALSFVVSLNLHRRHLSESQKAMVAARAKPLFEAAAKKRQAHGKTAPGKTLPVNFPEALGDARDKAGEALGVSGKSVDSASKVLNNGSASLQKAVDQGDVAVSAAAKLADLPKAKQTEIVKNAEKTKSTRKSLSDAAKKVTQIAASMDPWEASEQKRRKQIEIGSTVVANSANDSRLIAWAEENGLSVYVGRGSEWGNPFICDKDGDRDTVCDNYAWYLDRKPSLDCDTLRGKLLVCYCYPKRCHADELARRANGDT